MVSSVLIYLLKSNDKRKIYKVQFFKINMGLLKYLGRPEVIEVSGERTPTRVVMDGPFTRKEDFYPEGTKRIVRKYFMFPKEIGGIKVRGNQIVRQVCRYRISPPALDAGEFRHEEWDDQAVIPNDY